MPVLSAHNLSKAYGAQDVLSDVTCALAHGQHVALVGLNGSGKTTLLRLLTGQEDPSGGQVHRARGLSVGFLPQHADEALTGSHTVHEELLAVFADLRAQADELRRLEHAMADPDQYEAVIERYGKLAQQFEVAGGYTYEQRIAQTLSALNFDAADFERPIDHLSGGQKTRVLLARLILQEPDVMLLDEPTNHLDVEAVEWLEATLRDFSGALLIVAHDRYFLDAVAQAVWELDRGRLETYPGNYTQYTILRAERLVQQQAEYERQQAYITRQEDFIRRYMAGQKTRQAQGRLKRLERLERLQRPGDDKKLRLALQSDLRSGNIVLWARDLVVGYSPSEPLLECAWLEMRRKQRVALWGPNGTGKTTFLKTALGLVSPLGGEISFGASVQIGYFAQAHEALLPERSILDTVLDVQNMPVEQARGMLGRYLFSGDDVFKPISTLSGGESARVALCVLTLQGANVLLLDEPTNHLDIASQEVLEDILADFAGTILLVSHDRYLVDRLATHMWVVEDKQVTAYEGGYSAYLAQRQANKEQARQTKKGEREDKRKPALSPQQLEYARQKRRRTLRAAELEAHIAALETRLRDLSTSLEVAGVSGAVGDVQRLGAEYARLEAKLHQCLEEWEHIAQSLEQPV